MLDRACAGSIAAKPHLVFRSPEGALYYEECLTRDGFEGPFSIVYHQHRPHEAIPIAAPARFPIPERVSEPELSRRHYRCLDLPERDASPLSARVPLLFNEHVVVGFSAPRSSDTVYFVNADADELFFVLRGSGTVRSPFGDLRFDANDYVCVPKGVLHRFLIDEDVEQAWFSLELKAGLSLPRRYRNPVGQLRMDAPYSHRDFVRPEFRGPVDEHIRDQVVKRGDVFHGFRSEASPLDVVGWDGSVYPFVFPILAFQPRVGQVHLPPPAHATFEARGALICSFVPRLLDFHELANPCPYPHSSVDVDEVLFYANGAFGSRRGVGAGSLSHHPAGILHGPHPGAYEAVPNPRRTEELAVMLDTSAALARTEYARAIEDGGYHESFVA
jgi:homogentisate 1,2-dioxygenase